MDQTTDRRGETVRAAPVTTSEAQSVWMLRPIITHAIIKDLDDTSLILSYYLDLTSVESMLMFLMPYEFSLSITKDQADRLLNYCKHCGPVSYLNRITACAKITEVRSEYRRDLETGETIRYLIGTGALLDFVPISLSLFKMPSSAFVYGFAEVENKNEQRLALTYIIKLLNLE